MEKIFPRIDGHVHYAWPLSDESLNDVLKQSNIDAVCLAALPCTSRLDPTPDILCCKLLHPNTVFAFGCLDVSVYETETEHCGKLFVRHAKRLLAAGCDGIKLLEGKPTMRKSFAIPDFDSAAWEPFWAYAERWRVPLLWHVNDPEQFWNPDTLPLYARNSGWGYGPYDVNNEAQYQQVWNVLERHPRLNLTLPHMFFFSAQLPRLAAWLERFPLLRVDLAPGIELYENLSRMPDETRAFFLKFRERIHFGSDIGGRAVLKESVTELDALESARRIEIIDHFLCGAGEQRIEADGRYLIGSQPFILQGMQFDHSMLRQIEHDNFLAFVGRETPRKVSIPELKRYLSRLRLRLRARAKRTGIPQDLRAVEFDLDLLRRYRKREIQAKE